jgi:hypothetical protein
MSSIVRPVKNERWDCVSDCSVRDETYEVLHTHAATAEQDDRPAAESLDALHEDGVFALRTPRDHGGAWAGAEAIAGCLAGIARSCPSTAWIAATNVTAKNFAVRSSQDSLPDVFADPDVLGCGSGSPHGGSILMTGSNASLGAFPGWSVYAGSKAVQQAWARVWLNELKDRRIRVNVLTPGQVATAGRKNSSTRPPSTSSGPSSPRPDGPPRRNRHRRPLPRLRRLQLRQRHGTRRQQWHHR